MHRGAGSMATKAGYRDDLGRPCAVRPIIQLDWNGDPYGSGFTGSQNNGDGWFYRGDIGAMPRAWWRGYAWRMGFILREAR